jgi:hypothetical protein
MAERPSGGYRGWMGMLDIRLVNDRDGVPLLADWLRTDPGLGRPVVRALPPTIEPGEMGGLADTLQVVTEGGLDLGAIAASLAVWLRSRRRTVEVELTEADGRTVRVKVDGTRSDDLVERTIKQALEER